ncbi:MAG TPA: succinylglutamate desuccinylase/aspartoacylase family protein, partial [Thermomicrobiales bacterium]|nr:succinylglutamate desuccinylase/aspartoacylase family protein [Thermomicrobiales bacterium]
LGAGDTDAAVAAPADGLFRSRVRAGDEVAAGAPLGDLLGHDGRLIARLAAPADGVVAMVRRVPRVSAGEGLYLLTRRVA